LIASSGIPSIGFDDAACRNCSTVLMLGWFDFVGATMATNAISAAMKETISGTGRLAEKRRGIGGVLDWLNNQPRMG
jgi:hypothetical protein